LVLDQTSNSGGSGAISAALPLFLELVIKHRHEEF
jgi:hypothetical protein